MRELLYWMVFAFGRRQGSDLNDIKLVNAIEKPS